MDFTRPDSINQQIPTTSQFQVPRRSARRVLDSLNLDGDLDLSRPDSINGNPQNNNRRAKSHMIRPKNQLNFLEGDLDLSRPDSINKNPQNINERAKSRMIRPENQLNFDGKMDLSRDNLETQNVTRSRIAKVR